jgi:hypothetical protein
VLILSVGACGLGINAPASLATEILDRLADGDSLISELPRDGVLIAEVGVVSSPPADDALIRHPCFAANARQQEISKNK